MLGDSRMAAAVVLTLAAMTSLAAGGTFAPRPDYGYPAGLIPECPGVMKNASISPRNLEYLQVAVYRPTSSGFTQRLMPVESAAKTVAKDKFIDFKNKKTVFYAVGYWDTSLQIVSKALGNAYSKRGYNVFMSETFAFFTKIYPKSARLVRYIGIKMGQFLVELTHQGLTAENLELVGVSLGAHEASYAAKYFYSKTGKKPARLTGLDPAGPCFRSLDTSHKLWHTDAEKVDVIHTNIDGFGIAEALGHVDIYVNGGEYQPNDIPYIPCLVICSHVRSLIYWWVAVANPKKFIGNRCETIQDARFGDCYNSSVTNYMGLETKFDRPGIYYLPTNNEYPYYLGKNGTREGDNVYVRVTKLINAEDDWVA